MNKAFEKILEMLDERKQLHERMISYEHENGTITEEYQARKAVDVLNDAKTIVQEVAEEYEDGWIPIEEKLPPDDSFVLLSFSNFSVPIVGRYEEDEDGGGNFFAGDEDEPLISQDLFVNAWMPLPKPYEER